MTTDSIPGFGESESSIDARHTDSILDTLAALCYPLYRRLFSDTSEFVATVDGKLDEALRDQTVETFLSRAIAIGVVAGLVAWLLGLVAGYVVTVLLVEGTPSLFGLTLPAGVAGVVEAVKVPALILLTGVVFGAVGFGLGFGTPVLELYYRSDARKREINLLLPDTVAYMYALSVGGMNQLEILEAIGDGEDVYGEAAREFQTIVQETNYFDVDYRNAIKNRADETPSEPLRQFLTDMLAILNSGGDITQFLDEKTEKHMELAKQRQENRLQTLELLGEMYMTVSLLPLLLIILLVIMSMIGNAPDMLMYLTVYGLIPLTGVMFILVISTIKQEEYGDGYLRPDDATADPVDTSSVLDRSTTASYADIHDLFRDIHRREGVYILRSLLRRPHELFVERPSYTLVVTLPVALLWVAYAFAAGVGPSTFTGLTENPLGGTVVYAYVPMYLALLPLGIAYEWKKYNRQSVLGNLSETLRKLSSANDTGLTLLESFENVAETSAGRLAEEFDLVHAKVRYGSSLRRALIEFNNRYHVPRLARTVKLIMEAQETSSQITDVLRTAAQSSENKDDLRRNRLTRTRIQVVIIVMTFLTLLAVIAILQIQFIEVMAEIVAEVAGDGGGASGAVTIASDVNVDRLSMFLFHAVVLQATTAGFLSGYLTDSNLLSGVKYVLALSTVALVVWIPIA